MDGEATFTLLALVAVPLVAIWALHAPSREETHATSTPDDEELRLYRASSLPEAHLLRTLLEAEGIRALVKNELLAGAIGELPMMATLPEVWLVRGADEPRARTVLDAYRERSRSKLGPDVKCPECGSENPSNFELCWKCRKPLPA